MLLRGEPRRQRRVEHVGDHAGRAQPQHDRSPTAELRVRPLPEVGGDEHGGEEVREVDDPGHVVVQRGVGWVVVVPLEPHRRDRVVDQLVDPDLQRRVHRERRVRSQAPCGVVDPEDREERQPVEHKAAEPAPHVVQRQHEQPDQHPREDDVARQQDLLAGHDHDHCHRDVDRGGGECQDAPARPAADHRLGASVLALAGGGFHSGGGRGERIGHPHAILRSWRQ